MKASEDLIKVTRASSRVTQIARPILPRELDAMGADSEPIKAASPVPERTGRDVVKRGRHSGPITVGENTFPTLKAAALHHGLASNAVSVRLRDGWSLDEALGIVARARSKWSGEPVTVHGVNYPSRAAACNALGLDPRLVHVRLKSGRSVDEAFGIQDFDYKSKPQSLTLEGRAFPTLKAAAQFYGISKDVLNARVNRYGWTLSQALGIEPRPGYERGIVGLLYLVRHISTGTPYVGITMGTIEQRWAQHVEKAISGKRLSRSGLHAAIREHGPAAFSVSLLAKAKSLGELAELETRHIAALDSATPNGFNLNRGGAGTRTTGIKITVAGVKYPNMSAACRALHVPWSVVRGRLEKSWSPEQAFGLEPNPNAKRAKPIVLQGVTYASIARTAAAFGRDLKVVQARLMSGWSNEEAFGLLVRKPKTAISFQGNEYRSERAMCAHFGVSYNTYYARRRRNWSIAQALGLEDPSHEIEPTSERKAKG